MEKIEQNNTIKDVMTAPRQWRFTAFERQELEMILSNFEPGQVKQFISALEFYCVDLKQLRQRPDRTMVKDARLDLLRLCKKTVAALKEVETSRTCLHYRIEVLPASKNSASDMLKSFLLAEESRKTLEKFVSHIEGLIAGDIRPRGRNGADSSALIKTVAKIFREYLCRPPTTYKGGPFFEIVSFALKTVNLPFEDPSRGIQKALNKTV